MLGFTAFSSKQVPRERPQGLSLHAGLGRLGFQGAHPRGLWGRCSRRSGGICRWPLLHAARLDTRVAANGPGLAADASPRRGKSQGWRHCAPLRAAASPRGLVACTLHACGMHPCTRVFHSGRGPRRAGELCALRHLHSTCTWGCSPSCCCCHCAASVIMGMHAANAEWGQCTMLGSLGGHVTSSLPWPNKSKPG